VKGRREGDVEGGEKAHCVVVEKERRRRRRK